MTAPRRAPVLGIPRQGEGGRALAGLCALLLCALVVCSCGGHRRVEVRRMPATLDEAVRVAGEEYAAGGTSFRRYLDVLDSLGRGHPEIGGSFLHDDRVFESLLDSRLREGEITAEEYRSYLEMKLRFLKDYAGREARR